MEENTNTILDKVTELFNQEKFDEIIALLTDEVLKNEKDKAAELYIWRGNTWYNKKDYDNAIIDYSKAIDINPNYELAFYNRGSAWVAKKEYDKAKADYTKIIKLNSEDADTYYTARGNVWKAQQKYDKAIADYTKAIKRNPSFANAYYNRGLAKKEKNGNSKEIKQDFEKYLKLITDENDIWAKYAKYYIEEINEKIEDPELCSIKQSVNDIKDKLLIKEECVHYTSLSKLKKLILEESKFRISEGNFMNDPSEGEVFFKYLEYEPSNFCKNGSFSESFSPKPFIGSFVTEDKHNDLNMWRFYGKEAGIEAKGCAITLRTQEFIEDIKDFLANEKKEARLDNESDIHFYRVVYVVHNESTKFDIPNLDPKKSKELTDLMAELKEKVKTYKAKDKTSLEVCLNDVTFLFKSDAYKNENEVRLVVKGIEFEKKYCEENKEDKSVNPPRVYIELESIKKRVKQITLGPKVDKVNEWASAFHYSYEEDAPKIMISHLPYR
jgi:tetratricopeptide (TPR) repeat protein